MRNPLTRYAPRSTEIMEAADQLPVPADRPGEEPGPNLRRAAIAGILAILIGFGGFLTWGILAELDSAAIASGYVVVDSKRKTVSHLEGGILKRVLVSDGDVVAAGQPLIELDDTRARAELAQLRGAQIGFSARLARLRAEQQDLPAIEFPPELAQSTSVIAKAVMADERALFEKRKRLNTGKADVQRKQIEQFQAEADAAKSMADAADRQRTLVADQLEKIRGLAAKGFATWRSASDLETQLSQIIGNVGQYNGERAKAEQGKAGAEIALLSLEMDWQRLVAEDVQDTQLKLNEVEQKIIAQEDILSRLTVRAPQAGVVLDLQVTTPGSSVAAGGKLLDLVPENQPLLVEARLATRDIDAVRVGAPTQIRLTAYGQRTLAPLDGTLTYVGADQTVDERTGLAFYSLKASVSPDSLKRHKSVSLVPGMPADLVVKHLPRRAIDYFLEPITNTFQRAFREE